MKWSLPDIEYTRNISMFRKFTNVIAGTGTVFALLHVFIGYMSFDETPNASTGEVPKFFDNVEYRYYLLIAAFFALSVVASWLLNRLPALTVLPSAATTTFLMLLFDADRLPKGPMTFLQFSLFVLAGNMIVTLFAKGSLHREMLRYVVSGIGLFAAGWAVMIYFRAPNAVDQLFGLVPPIEALDGIEAVQRYERLVALSELAGAGNHVYYLRVALAQLLAAAAVLLLSRYRTLTGISAVLMFAYPAVLFSFSHLTYFPMFCVVPMLVFSVGCAILCLTREKPATEGATEEGTDDESKPQDVEEPAPTENGTV